ncbi:patatin-like protein [Sandaracinobacteroides hominis]|uniref:patatin-like protein n=1 Tax=Sandaracinobacteroides hominis TaxID=2780086 RepID=UPI0018F36298|nr:patatin-like protein [Sandaracinobacteroides hominis]
MIREKELRLALVCYGGVSLAVYMHGVTKELWKLLKASEGRKCGRELPGDTEPVWRDMLNAMADTVDLTVMCDILAGASAGGINTVLLSNAITVGETLEPLTDMWLEEADVDRLLDPAARSRSPLAQRFAHFYKEPVAWFAARRSATLASVDVPEVRAEIAAKLAGFVRSRWFQPPFSGEVLTAMIDRAMDAMASAPKGPPLLPPTLPLDLYVTVTDYWGMEGELAIHSPPIVTEREHRRLFAFYSPAVTRRRGVAHEPVFGERLPAAERPALLLAARATSCFPGAFPPATISEVDRRLEQTCAAWPGRAEFVRTQLAGDRAPEDIALIDGSVLNNAPFGPAINAVRLRAAHRETDRRFVYVDPNPGSGQEQNGNGKAPGFFNVIFRSMAGIPREQPIRDSLEAINALSTRIRRVKHVIDSMTPAVDAAIVRAVGARFFLLKVTPERLSKARSRIQSLAAAEAGFAFAAYAQLKLRVVLEEAVGLLVRAARLGKADAARLQIAILEEAAARGAFAHDAAVERGADASGYVRVLKQLDIGFRVRRLSFFIRRLSLAIIETTDPEERAACETLKATLHAVAAPFQNRRAPSDPPEAEALAIAARAILAAATPVERAEAAGYAIDRLGIALGLSSLDAEADRVLVDAVNNPGFSRDMRRSLIRAWLGFPFYDIAILPLMQDEAADSLDEMKVDRISPDDAFALRKGGARATLKGWQLNAFAGFFSRAYRENDYLWGRLHAAERLVDIVISAAPETSFDADHWKGLLFNAILSAEKTRLRQVQPLIAELEGEMQRWGSKTP